MKGRDGAGEEEERRNSITDKPGCKRTVPVIISAIVSNNTDVPLYRR